MDYSALLNSVCEIIQYSYPVALIFGLVGKLVNFSLDLILNRKISL